MDLSALPADLTTADVARQFGSSGYVVESVPLALFAARSITHLPLDVVLHRTIEAGGDTDTVASMTGQIAGAWIGASKISREMIDSLVDGTDIEQISEDFARTVEP
jgi:ADP-ribosylglycohydrolase